MKLINGLRYGVRASGALLRSSRSSSGNRAGQFTDAFDTVLADAKTTVAKIPPRSTRANAYAERFVLTARTKLTDRVLIVGERHLRHVMGTFARHCNGWRPHRALDLASPRNQRPIADLTEHRIRRRPVLGDPLSKYERAA